MRAKLYLFCLLILLMACGPAPDDDVAKVTTKPMSLPEMQKRKAEIDDAAGRDNASYTVLAKVKGRAGLLPVTNNQWPENMEYNYNILKDNKGAVLMIAATPANPRGDWFATLTHYFTRDGKTFAFERLANAFVLPHDEVAFETTVDYYDTRFKSVEHSYKLVDKNQQPLDKQYAFNNNYLVTKTYPDLEEVFKAYNIKL